MSATSPPLPSAAAELFSPSPPSPERHLSTCVATQSSPAPRFVKPKTEPGLAPVKTEHGEVELDDDAALEWARQDSLKMARERQCAALRRFAQRRRGRDEGGVVIIDDSDDDDDAPPPPPAGEGSSRGARVKEEKADDGGDDGDFSAFSKFFY